MSGDIRNEEQAKEIWHWYRLTRGCFGLTNISPMDVDGLVERNGRFLIMEAKHPSAKTLPEGQHILLKRLATHGAWTVMVIRGETDRPESVEVWLKRERLVFPKVDVPLFRRIINEWFRFAEQMSDAPPAGRPLADRLIALGARRETLPA